MLSEMEIETRDEVPTEGYKLYKRRYAIMGTVAILNISNAVLWCTYAPVATTVSGFYDVSLVAVNFFSLSFLIMTFPFCFISTFIIDRYGLRFAIHIGSALNVFGSIIKALGTSAIFSDPSTKYTVSIIGQVFSGMGQSFILFIPTKTSQNWFPENQRAIATTILAMSNPLGIVIGQVATPFIIVDKEDVSTNNYIWMALAIVAEICAIVFVTRDKPKTPPSKSALLQQDTADRPTYLQQLKTAYTTPAYMFLLLTLGAGIGVFSAFSTITQQVLCSVGYTDVIAGSATGVMILMGFVGAAITGILADKTKEFTLITKLAFGGAAFFVIFMIEFYLVPDQTAALVIFCGLFGIFGIGAYPVGLELAVETTYPVEETISTAFVFLSGQVHGIFIILLIPLIATEKDSTDPLNECSTDTDDDITPKDYTVPFLILAAYMVAVVVIMIIFMKTKHKRLEAELSTKAQKRNSISKIPP